MPPRLYVPQPLQPAAEFALPEGAARHVQVLRLQPGAPLRLFDGHGGEWSATVRQMGRQAVQVSVDEHHAVEREIRRRVTLAVGMPANERMDALVEKASELGVTAVQPLMTERSVLRLQGERAERKRLHWQSIAVAACEQCGRNSVPVVHAVRTLPDWLAGLPPAQAQTRWVLSLREALDLSPALEAAADNVLVLNGPEGGLGAAEEALAVACGFVAVSLGPRTLRADTAPIAALTLLGP